MKVKLVQIDGDLPNLALMKVAHYLRFEKSAEIFFSRSARRDMFEPEYDLVLASQIFSVSAKKARALEANYPNVEIYGTGTDSKVTIEKRFGIKGDYKHLDYSIYPDFQLSIGMTQVGCSSKCPFCCVPEKEGANRPWSNISEIYRGEPFEKKLILIDNDFQNRTGWQTVCEDIITGGFQVAFIQGINIRKLTPEHGAYFSQMKFRDLHFNRKRFYCAWDNEKDKKRIEKGLAILDGAGFNRSDITPYLLCNYWTEGLSDDVWSRFLLMAEWKVRPYVMIFEKWKLPPRDDLKVFQNWVNTRNAFTTPTREGFAEYKAYYTRSRARGGVGETGELFAL